MNSQLSSLLKSNDADAATSGDRRAGATGRDWRARSASALPWLLIAGFVSVLAVVFGDRIVPARELSVATVVTDRQNADTVTATTSTKGETDVYEAPMLFQASGWVEPDPYPVMATALVDGVVESVEVLEGEKVEKGQLLARLIDEDARLNLETAQSELSALQSRATAHRRQIDIAEAEIESLEKQVVVAEARRDEATDVYERLNRVSTGGVAEREISEARLRVATLEAEIEALQTSEGELKAKIEQLHQICIAFESEIRQKETDVARKQLALDRTRIESPIHGRVLRLLVAPGQKRMLGMDSMDSATVAVLYDPNQLQARIDVPLAEAAQLSIGQPVRIRSELLPGKTFRGSVTRIVGEADLQRNTLQAKVAIENPDDRLRPEMLCRAEFLANSRAEDTEASAPATSSERVRIFVPGAALIGDDESVWKVDPSGERVVRQAIELGRETREDHQLVLSGLKPGDRVVVDPPSDLKTGERFRPLEK